MGAQSLNLRAHFAFNSCLPSHSSISEAREGVDSEKGSRGRVINSCSVRTYFSLVESLHVALVIPFGISVNNPATTGKSARPGTRANYLVLPQNNPVLWREYRWIHVPGGERFLIALSGHPASSSSSLHLQLIPLQRPCSICLLIS